jgi:hypothetical protein
MSYLTYNPTRNIAWTYHAKWPKGAIKKEKNTAERWPESKHLKNCLQIFKFNEDETVITLVPRSEWEAESS